MIVPSLGRSSPVITANRVDFPDPDGPVMAKVSDGATSKSTPRRMLTAPAALSKVRATPRIWTKGLGAGGIEDIMQTIKVRGVSGLLAYRVLARTVNTALLILVVLMAAATAARAEPVTIVVLGDSLTAGYGLDADDAFPARLQVALAADGVDAVVINAGVSGDTSAGGLSRLVWSMGDAPDLAIIELGANDALRGLAPDATYENLSAILQWLDDQRIPGLLAGMLAPPNMGEDYGRAFNAIFPALAANHGVPLYPFFLAGVIGEPRLLQDDGMHPTPEGVELIAAGILPFVVQALGAVVVN